MPSTFSLSSFGERDQSVRVTFDSFHTTNSASATELRIYRLSETTHPRYNMTYIGERMQEHSGEFGNNLMSTFSKFGEPSINVDRRFELGHISRFVVAFWDQQEQIVAADNVTSGNYVPGGMTNRRSFSSNCWKMPVSKRKPRTSRIETTSLSLLMLFRKTPTKHCQKAASLDSSRPSR